jgi:hypothetical protein
MARLDLLDLENRLEIVHYVTDVVSGEMYKLPSLTPVFNDYYYRAAKERRSYEPIFDGRVGMALCGRLILSL